MKEEKSCCRHEQKPQASNEISKQGAVYTCPMHPEVVSDKPGACPKCGMALEPKEVENVEEKNPELEDMSRRFWISFFLSLPLAIFTMGEMFPVFASIAHASWFRWVQFALATPVVLWGG